MTDSSPHTHFTEAERVTSNLGARMFAAKFDASDNPYHYQQHQDLHEAWWRGFNWASQLTKVRQTSTRCVPSTACNNLTRG